MSFEYDPERALWRPGRRTFLFMFGAAAVGAALGPGKEELQFHRDAFALEWGVDYGHTPQTKTMMSFRFDEKDRLWLAS